MENKFIYSTTVRCLGEKNNIINFKNGLSMIEKSKFNNANFNFCEIQELLDDNNYKEIFKDLIYNCSVKFNVAHAPIHFPFFFNDYYKLDKKDLYEQRILKSIELATKINVKWIVLHIGTVLDSNGDYDFENSVKENIKYLDKFVRNANANGLKIAIENGTNMEKEVTPTIDELIKIVDYYNNLYNKEVLGICFDFGHANVAKLNIYNELINIGNRLKVTHIHDNYGTDTHNFPYQGEIKWEQINKAFEQIKYNGELTLEVRYKNDIFDENIINTTYHLLDEICFKTEE